MTSPQSLILAFSDSSLSEAVRRSFEHLTIIEPRSLSGLPEHIGEPAWAFIDWLLPESSGLELCRHLRASPSSAHAHITLVLEDAEPETRRRALNAGADDYMLGPITLDQIADRVGMSGSAPPANPHSDLLVHGSLQLDPAAHRVWVGNRPASLRPQQFALLRHFMLHPDRVHSRVSLLKVMGHGTLSIDERTVDVSVGRLRRALRELGAPDPLRTVRNVGYVFDSRR